MSKKVWLNNPYEKQSEAKAFLRKKWSEYEQFQEINRRQRVLGNRDLDPEERKKRLSYWFYTYLLTFMFMASAIGIVLSMVTFAFRSPAFLTSVGILILAIFLNRTKKSAAGIRIKLTNFPISRKSKAEQQRIREKGIKEENEREIGEFLEGRR